MADDRYGGYGRGDWRRREDSIFSDDDRGRQRGRERGWSGSPRPEGRERGGRDEDRGFFDRAGDEVRSWFGDEEAERRRERDVRRDEAREAFAGGDDDRRYEAGRGRYGSGGQDYERSGGFGAGASFAPDQAGYGQSIGGRRDFEDRSGFAGGRSQYDDNYRRWREQQMQRFDREYADYCRERQQQFEQDFDSWRSSRLTEGGVGGASPQRDEGGRERTSRGTGSQGAGATTGGGTASATRSSSGSAGETENAIGAGGETGGASRGRGGRSRG